MLLKKNVMKKILHLILLLILLSTIETTAQAPAWIWATSAGGTDWDNSNGISTNTKREYVCNRFL